MRGKKIDFSRVSTTKLTKDFYTLVNADIWCDPSSVVLYEYVSKTGLEAITRERKIAELYMVETRKNFYRYVKPISKAYTELVALYTGTHPRCKNY